MYVDDVAVNRVAKAMGYITQAQIAVCDLAFTAQYFDKPKTTFRDEAVKAYCDAMACGGYQQGVAAANVAAAANAAGAAG